MPECSATPEHPASSECSTISAHPAASGHPAASPHHTAPDRVRVIAWEVTRQCPMACKHCRGASRNTTYEGELTTAEALKVIDSLGRGQPPMIIFTGGEPMFRHDLPELVRHATSLGCRCVLAPCGWFATVDRLRELKAAGIRMLSISVDGATAEAHNAFRGVEGAFDIALKALDAARTAELPFQINTTVTRQTAGNLRAMRDFALAQHAHQIDYFFLVPVGRGKALSPIALNPAETDKVLLEIIALDNEGVLPIHVTCAPQIMRLTQSHPTKSRINGCLGGTGFAFISHVGELQPCGFFDHPCGNVRDFDFDFRQAYARSEVFQALRKGPTSGHCASCAFGATCRGCRARALAETNDYLAQDASCIFAQHS